ncbi:MAG: YqgE/AlgH family protein [Bacteroidales bacterium]|nr:YqgE/AlgH family protein [Bacteroidales bacterium]
MDLNIDLLKIKSNNVFPQKGRVLIAEPLMPDFLFGRSVILLTDDKNDSHSGLILNYKSGMKVGEVMSAFDGTDADLYIGGPVDNDVLFWLHEYGDLILDSKHIFGSVYLGGNFDQMLELYKAGIIEENKIRFYLGYSGWDYFQLEAEIEENTWLVAPVDEGFVFSESSNLWKRSLDYVDSRYDIWKNFPEDPEWN